MTVELTLSDWSPTSEGPDIRPELTVYGLLAEAVAEVPDREALIEGLPDASARRRWTFAELHADVERTARYLLHHFSPGDHVAIWAPNLPEWVIVEYAAGLAGLVIVTVNPSLQPDEVRYVLAQSESVGCLIVPEARGNPLMAHLEAVREDLPALHTVLRLDTLLDDVAANVDRDADVALPTVTGDDTAQIQYTSGTTGFPKGVMLRHRGLANNAACWADRAGMPGELPWLSPMPLFHTGGCVLAVLGAVVKRSPLVLMPGFEPTLMLDLVEGEQVACMVGVPTMLIAVMGEPTIGDRDLSSLRAIVSGGAQVPEALVRQIEDALGVSFTIVYGQTEASPAICNTAPTDSTADKGTTVGQPLAHTSARVVDPATLEVQPVDTPGELWAKGYFTMVGYYNNPEATADTVVDDGWLRTGDLVTMDSRGFIRIVGRLKDMIIRGGENLFPVEIEEVLIRHDSIAEIAVVGLPDDRWGEIVAAFIRVAPGADEPTVAELRSHARDHLSPQKTPTRWFTLDSFPLTGSGKIRKNVLRDQFVEGRTFTELGAE